MEQSLFILVREMGEYGFFLFRKVKEQKKNRLGFPTNGLLV